jgi:hypothetical protein
LLADFEESFGIQRILNFRKKEEGSQSQVWERIHQSLLGRRNEGAILMFGGGGGLVVGRVVTSKRKNQFR